MSERVRECASGGTGAERTVREHELLRDVHRRGRGVVHHVADQLPVPRRHPAVVPELVGRRRGAAARGVPVPDGDDPRPERGDVHAVEVRAAARVVLVRLPVGALAGAPGRLHALEGVAVHGQQAQRQLERVVALLGAVPVAGAELLHALHQLPVAGRLAGGRPIRARGRRCAGQRRPRPRRPRIERAGRRRTSCRTPGSRCLRAGRRMRRQAAGCGRRSARRRRRRAARGLNAAATRAP